MALLSGSSIGKYVVGFSFVKLSHCLLGVELFSFLSCLVKSYTYVQGLSNLTQ